MMKLFCQAGQHEWERPAQRGRPPLNCPEHAAARPKRDPSAPKLSAEQRNSPERMAELREIKAQREQERDELARGAERERNAERIAELPALQAMYEEAFDADDFDKADRLQAKIIYASRLSRA